MKPSPQTQTLSSFLTATPSRGMAQSEALDSSTPLGKQCYTGQTKYCVPLLLQAMDEEFGICRAFSSDDLPSVQGFLSLLSFMPH